MSPRHFPILRACATAIVAVVIAGCSNPRSRAEDTLRKVGAEQLRTDAAILYKSVFAGHGAEVLLLKSKQYPAAFQRFAPLRVGAYSDGFSLALVASSDTEAGLYVVPQTMEFQPKASRDGTFERLAEGVYWYSFGTRK